MVEIDYIGKENDKGDGSGEGGAGSGGLEGILKSYPKITAKYSKSIPGIEATASIENGTLKKMELIYKGQILTNETRISDLDKSQIFKVDSYGTGWYKVKVTAETRRRKKKRRKIKNGMGKSNKRKRRTSTTSHNI